MRAQNVDARHKAGHARRAHAMQIGRRSRIWLAPLASARRASTPTRCARYSALPWMSRVMPSAGIVMPSIDFGEKRFFSASSKLGHAEHAVGAGAGHRDANVGAALGHEHADQRKARGRMRELLVGRLLGDRELHLGDDLVGLERGLEHALEEIVGRDAALVGDDGRAETEARPPDSRRSDRCWRASRRWCRDGAPPDRRSSPASSASAGMRILHDRRVRDFAVPRHGADHDRAALQLDAGEAFDLATCR